MCVFFLRYRVCTVKEPVCCGFSPSDCLSVINSSEINDALMGLCDDDIQANGDLFSKTEVPESLEDCSPAQRRLLSYRKVFRIIEGVGKKGRKVKLPSCVRKGVTLFFPDE